MNYRHAYHAGNFADVLKHAGVVAVLRHLRKKDAPFAVIDTHAGCGLYDLGAEEAAKTGEAQDGIVKLLAEGERLGGLPGVLGDYAGLVRRYGPGRYPGSPLIAAALLRAQDRLAAFEKHPDEHASLAKALGGYARAQARLGDGYAGLGRLLPPPERRAMVLIDPPYESEDDFSTAVQALLAGTRRFATGIFLLWYPVKGRAEADAAAGELVTGGVSRLLRIELDLGAAPAANETRLSAAGILVVNAPYGFLAEMESAARFLARCLAKGPAAQSRVECLAGEG